MPVPRSLTVDEVAKMAQLNPATIRAEIKRGNLEAWRVGKQFRIEPEAIEAWKAKGAVKKPAPRRDLRRLEP